MYCIRKRIAGPLGSFETVLEEEDMRIALNLLKECRDKSPKEKFYLTRTALEEVNNNGLQ